MDKLLGTFQKFMPLLTFYPKPVQLLFLATLVLFLVSFAAFVIFYPSASGKQTTAEAAKVIPAEIKQIIDRDLAGLGLATVDLGSAMSNYYAASVALRLHLLNWPSKMTLSRTTDLLQ